MRNNLINKCPKKGRRLAEHMSGYGDISRAVTLGSTSRRPAPLITTANRQSISQSSHPPQHTLSSSPSRSPPAPDPAAVALVVPGGYALSSSPARRRRRCPPPSHPASLSSAQRIKPAAFAAQLLRVPSCVLRRSSPVSTQTSVVAVAVACRYARTDLSVTLPRACLHRDAHARTINDPLSLRLLFLTSTLTLPLAAPVPYNISLRQRTLCLKILHLSSLAST